MKSTGAAHFAILMVVLAESSSFSSALDETRSDSTNAASDSSTKNETGACGIDCDMEEERDMPGMGRVSKSVNDEYQELVESVNKRFHDAKNSQQAPPCQAECNYYCQLYCSDESFRHIDQCNTCTWVGRCLALFATATVLVTVRRACMVWRATLHHIALVKVGR